nr:hypothetical protein [Tanacetum cinerariifolium]
MGRVVAVGAQPSGCRVRVSRRGCPRVIGGCQASPKAGPAPPVRPVGKAGRGVVAAPRGGGRNGCSACGPARGARLPLARWYAKRTGPAPALTSRGGAGRVPVARGRCPAYGRRGVQAMLESGTASGLAGSVGLGPVGPPWPARRAGARQWGRT